MYCAVACVAARFATLSPLTSGVHLCLRVCQPPSLKTPTCTPQVAQCEWNEKSEYDKCSEFYFGKPAAVLDAGLLLNASVHAGDADVMQIARRG